MDADSRRRRRDSSISLPEQRWTMSSQRLEQIVAALMKPVSHYGQSFDRDDSGLLEQYLTAAGLRALEALEAGREPPAHNYAELGLVIQSFANNYSKKVDHLSRLVASFSRTLDSADVRRSSERDAMSPEPGAAPRGRRRASSGAAGAGAGAGFAPISLTAHAGARRGAWTGGPPPTLPRVYAELQPRAPAPERALHDHDGEPIGCLDDFRVAWRLHNGFLVEELESSPAVSPGECDVRAMSLVELQEACARAAAPAPPGPPPSPPPPSRPPSPATTPPAMAPPAALRRKRRSEVRIDDLTPGSFNFNMDDQLRRRLAARAEFSLNERWIRRVVRHRRDVILRARRDLSPPERGFRGWSGDEAREAAAAVRRARGEPAPCEPAPCDPAQVRAGAVPGPGGVVWGRGRGRRRGVRGAPAGPGGPGARRAARAARAAARRLVAGAGRRRRAAPAARARSSRPAHEGESRRGGDRAGRAAVRGQVHGARGGGRAPRPRRVGGRRAPRPRRVGGGLGGAGPVPAGVVPVPADAAAVVPAVVAAAPAAARGLRGGPHAGRVTAPSPRAEPRAPSPRAERRASPDRTTTAG